MKIDIHTHILPKEWPNLKEKYGYGGWINLDHHKTGCARMMKDKYFFREVESNCWNPDVRMNECEHHGVDVQVLSTVPVMFNYWAKPDDAMEVSKMLNNHIASIAVSYTHLRAHETRGNLVCRLLLEKKIRLRRLDKPGTPQNGLCAHDEK